MSSLTKQRDDEKTQQFLTGLDDLYATVRSDLLAQDPLPLLNKVYELLLIQEERQRTTMKNIDLSDDFPYRGTRHLPEDLLPDILCRLPVKSLLRFRCVSKPWLSLVDDADFAQLHLNTFNNNRYETRLFVFKDRSNCVVPCSDTFKPISELEIPFRLLCWDIVSFVDGLILLRSKSCDTLTALKLWNPSLRTLLDIPPPVEIGTATPSSFGPFLTDTEIGLGYDPLSKDYKFVKLIFVRNTNTMLDSVAIYTVGAGSWKIIPFKGNGSSSCSEWRWLSSIRWKVHLKGSLYFIAKDANKVRDLVYFDLSKEVFSVVVSKPPDDPYFMNKKKLALVDGGSSVAMYNDTYRHGGVWVLDSETMSWTKRYSYPSPLSRLLFVNKKGEILTSRTHEERFSDKTGKVKWLWRDLVASYSPEKPEYKILQENRGDNFSWITNVSAYVESLILHNKKSNANI